MNLEQDLARIAEQEKRLRFDRFDAQIAWEIATQIKALAEARGASVAFDISLNNQLLFFYAMPGTSADNADWIRRKRNVTQRFNRSSYGVGLSLQQRQATLQSQQALPERDFATHGGCFPVFVGDICVGSITVSGLPQRQDHAMVVEVLAVYLNQPLAELALED